MRTHVVLPDKLVQDVDKLVGKRRRSHFMEEAIREKLKRDKLLSALQQTAGIISADDYPDWSTTEKVAAWVRQCRQEDIGRTKRLLPNG